MRYLLLILILICTVTLFAQALPRGVFVKIQTADGSSLSPSDIFIRAYFQERPEQIQTSLTRPKHLKSMQLDSIHKGFYVIINLAAFQSNWEIGEILIADITQESTSAAIHCEITIPAGTNTVWIDDTKTLTHSVPSYAINPTPLNNAAEVSLKLEGVSWAYNQVKGYSIPVGFRFVIDTDSLFGNASISYLKNTKKNKYTMGLPNTILPLKHNTTYYWKIIPTVSTDQKIQSTSLRPIIINGKLLKSKESGDAVNVPVWHFTTGD